MIHNNKLISDLLDDDDDFFLIEQAVLTVIDMLDNDDNEEEEMEQMEQQVEHMEEEENFKISDSISCRSFINRNHANEFERLFNDYFSDKPAYDNSQFRKRFRMNRSLFLRIVNDVKTHDSYFVPKIDAAHKVGLATLQKITVALCKLIFGSSSDSLKGYVNIGASTALECLKHFCYAIVSLYEKEYMRSPTQEDIKRLMMIGEERGFPGMIGSVNGMHWTWRGCPTSWHEKYQEKDRAPTFVIEASSSRDLWLWNVYFGFPSAINDPNLHPFLFSQLKTDLPQVEYTINNHHYHQCYYLSDNIYQNTTSVMKALPEPKTKKEKNFAMFHKETMKDIETAFEVLQKRFAMVRKPARLGKEEDLTAIIKTCIILHNMIAEDERNENLDFNYDAHSVPVHSSNKDESFAAFVENTFHIVQHQTESQLQNDLIDHLWDVLGNQVAEPFIF